MFFVPAGTVVIDACCFQGADVEEVRFPTSVEYVGACAFAGCARLRKVTFPAASRLKSVEARAFAGCAALREVTLPAGTVVAPGAFEAGVRVARE